MLGSSRTAHRAQGKTLAAVGSDLNFRGAMAYVIASRARTRHGLALLQPLTSEALNKPPPRHLREEDDRQRALEHNTLVRLGYIQGDIVPVPDPEAKARVVLTDPSGKVKLTWKIEGEAAPERPVASALSKRQISQDLSNPPFCKFLLLIRYSLISEYGISG